MTIGKISIRPTTHYLSEHSDVDWSLVLRTILSPDKTRPNVRHGKNRFTYLKRFKEFIIELHVERDPLDDTIWVINAFKVKR